MGPEDLVFRGPLKLLQDGFLHQWPNA